VKDAVVSKRGERGAALILITFVATFVLIPIVGLAIDGTLLYWMKARLSAAVDSAALAAGRSLNVGDDEAAQELSATTVGQQYFSANFPTGTGPRAITITGGAPTITYVKGTYVRTVTVSATAIVPLYFMPILRVDTGTLVATGTASRRDANVILVLDRSGSMSAKGNNSCTALISAVQNNFIEKFANGRDRLGLVTFSTMANVDFAPSLTFKTDNPKLSDTLSKLVCIGGTSTAEGLWTAHDQIKKIQQPGAFNVILLFTDGSPSSILANFPVKTQVDARYDPIQTGQVDSQMPASGCPSSSDPIRGVIADSSADVADIVAHLQTTGVTLGLFAPTAVPLSSSASPAMLQLSGCTFSSSIKNPSYYARRDVAYIPATDTRNDATNGAVYPLAPGVDIFDSTSPYHDQIRPDVPRTQRWVAFNAADAQAQQIRADTTYAPVIYTIGLAGNEKMAMNQNFMERLANDPRANNYDSTKPEGMFRLATDQMGLAQAFSDIASQVLHLSN
jgi:Flp pilus assembly protein TadG